MGQQSYLLEVIDAGTGLSSYCIARDVREELTPKYATPAQAWEELVKPKPTPMDKLIAAVDKATNYSMENATIRRVIDPALKHLKIKL